MATIENQLSAPPSAVSFKKCAICEGMDPSKSKFDELRRRALQWEDQMRNHEAEDVDFVLRKAFDQYVNMVATSRASREQQSCEKERRDVVRYHSMSYETFADHFRAPHRPTRESRNVEKNDAVENLYTTHLKMMAIALDRFKREGKEGDLKTYNELAKTLKTLNDVSVSARFLPFHTVRKSIHK